MREQKLLIIYEAVEGFNHKSFLEGAKKAFEIIITAYNQGEKKTLKGLVSKDVPRADSLVIYIYIYIYIYI